VGNDASKEKTRKMKGKKRCVISPDSLMDSRINTFPPLSRPCEGLREERSDREERFSLEEKSEENDRMQKKGPRRRRGMSIIPGEKVEDASQMR